MSINKSPDHHVTTPQSSTSSTSSSLSPLSRDATPPPYSDVPHLRGIAQDDCDNGLQMRRSQSALRRSVSSYSVGHFNYHPNGGSNGSISTIATTAVLVAHNQHGVHQHRHRHSSPAPDNASAYPLVVGLRSQVKGCGGGDETSAGRLGDVSNDTNTIAPAHQSSLLVSSSKGRFRKFAVKVIKWVRQSLAEKKGTRADLEVRLSLILHYRWLSSVFKLCTRLQ